MDEWSNAIFMLQVYQSALFAIIAFAMFFRHGNYSKKYLGWFMILSAAYALFKALGIHGHFQLFRYIYPLGVAMLLSLFPFFYFYLKSLIIPDYRFSNRELIHLLPAVLLFLVSVTVYILIDVFHVPFTPSATAYPDYFWPEIIRRAYYFCIFGYFSMQIVIYSIRIATLFRLHKSNIEKSFSYTNSISLHWVFTMMMLFLLFLFLLGLSRIIGLSKDDLFHKVVSVLEFLTVLIFATFAILQHDIYPRQEETNLEPVAAGEPPDSVLNKGTDDNGVNQSVVLPQAAKIDTGIVPCEAEDSGRVKKYAGSGLTERQKNELGKKLDKLMKEKLYLKTKLTIDEVAEKLETNSKYLSQMINESQQKNFYTYINTFRIEEAKRLLKENQHQKYSIQGIARIAGFSSKSSFNEAFRRIVGMTPSEYLEKK